MFEIIKHCTKDLILAHCSFTAVTTPAEKLRDNKE